MSSWEPATDDSGVPREPAESRPAGVRLELPAVGWLFVAAAVFVVVARLVRIAGSAPEMVTLYAIAPAIASALRVLLPAALLVRVPDAPRTQRLLFAGLATGAAVAWLHAAIFAWSPSMLTGNPSVWTVVPALLPPLEALAALLVGLGLLQLRARRSTRAGLLVVIVALELGFLLGQLGLAAAWAYQPLDLGFTAVNALVAAAGAFAAWVPVAAWLDRDPPRAFWELLALAFPLGLLAEAIGLTQTIAMTTSQPGGRLSNDLFLVVTTAQALIGAVVSLLAIAAYARGTPLPGRASHRS